MQDRESGIPRRPPHAHRDDLLTIMSSGELRRTPLRRSSTAKGIASVRSIGQPAPRRRWGGLLVILDEFGKFLEHVSLHSETEDLFVMQGLAEAASRSPVPILLVTMLHTAFAEYLGASADDSRRAEWQKVQGRFTDVAFQEPPWQLLRLVGSAIVRERIPQGLEADYTELVDRAVSSPALEEARRRLPLEELLPDCTPLDPVVGGKRGVTMVARRSKDASA